MGCSKFETSSSEVMPAPVDLSAHESGTRPSVPKLR